MEMNQNDESCDIDLTDEFDNDENNEQRNSVVRAEEFNELITEFDNAEIVEDISVLNSVPSTEAVFVPYNNLSPSIPVAETTYVDYNDSFDDDMLVEAIEVITCGEPFGDDDGMFNFMIQEDVNSQFVEYSTDPLTLKHEVGDVQSLHNKMDAFISDNNIFDSSEHMEEDDIEAFATAMQEVERDHVSQTSEQIENKQIMQAMVVSNQQHIQDVTALQQQEEEIAVQIGPICTAPFQPDGAVHFAVGSTNEPSAPSTQKKKSTSKKKKEKKHSSGFAPEAEESYTSQKNVLRQEATAKRKRTQGKFAKRKIDWVTITEAMERNSENI